MSQFGDFGPTYLGMVGSAASGGAVTIAVQDFETGTSTGALSVTSSAITGVTPEAVLLIGARHAPVNDPLATTHANLCIGAIDASRVFYANTISESGQTATDSQHRFYDVNIVYQMVNANGSVRKQATGTLASGGASLNFTSNNDASWRGVMVAFTGANAAAYAGVATPTTGGLDITAPAFAPDAVICIGTNMDKQAGGIAGLQFCFGVATADNTQRCVLMSEPDAATDSAPVQAILTTRVFGQLSTAGVLDYHVTASAFDANGFTLTASASVGSDDLGYIALSFGSGRAKIVDLTTPTSTGSSTITGAGFTPQFALVVLTNLEAVDPAFPISTADTMAGLSISCIGNEQWATGIRVNAGEATTDTDSYAGNHAIVGASATSAKAILASFTAWTADGMTVNYSAVQATAKKGFILFVEQAT